MRTKEYCAAFFFFFLHFSKDFDAVNYNFLIYKLNRYGVRGHSFELWKLYLVKINETSQRLLCNIGVS